MPSKKRRSDRSKGSQGKGPSGKGSQGKIGPHGPSTSSVPPSRLRWVVGIHAAFEALRVRPDWVEEVSLLPDRDFDPEQEKSLEKFSSQTVFRKASFFDSLSDVHQGIAVGLNQRPRWDEDLESDRAVAFLDGLNDPHNLGAILRTSWLFGLGGLFLPKNRSVRLTPTVSKVACGGSEHIPVEEVHFQSQVATLKEQGFWIYGLSEKASTSLFDIRLPAKAAFMVGAEGKGLRSSSENLCDELVGIPQVDPRASLNAWVAFSLAIYEYQRQRHAADTA